jgi:hypothetical protein
MAKIGASVKAGKTDLSGRDTLGGFQPSTHQEAMFMRVL